MTNHEKYYNLLFSILENVRQLNNTALILLKNTKIPTEQTPIPNQSTATHSQHFIYLALEELGKFFLILGKYNNNLEEIKLKEIGFYDHDVKIKYLGDFIKKTQLHPNSGQIWTSDMLAKKLRILKETNVYVDYKNNEIIKPVPKRGEGFLQIYADILSNGIILAELAFQEFKNK
ncbi:hypothetical protein A2467_02090 [Candidatus Nomurabacteria bacterium RIFOXYC2_FULL_36_8]|nr:MAG: hypothetical protein UR97_C0002G0112 [Candidatus Nomurabacteria bacterium GW2011_GWE2_36_115]KKP94517.1 MAG: hypothetical protein US00_C0001G0111 [Candidatus Nomurabacteria bacterium GW2011_GWF2_36_126]KKP96979.1 MAG: hypothetical protein US04_C0001G0482 [Candidatus Nomurabacteria bacterium GW2011_GWD2_36_14]KKP99417.1 MAG: hypothetical protein US08_C0001G0099 [Candidatus Nomurabacteria bacterium GW2011_GWF2_36_19]KKQ05727.1 MAG: hypothetical protein US17_C0002G0111 [Candidatus Nomuraba